MVQAYKWIQDLFRSGAISEEQGLDLVQKELERLDRRKREEEAFEKELSRKEPYPVGRPIRGAEQGEVYDFLHRGQPLPRTESLASITAYGGVPPEQLEGKTLEELERLAQQYKEAEEFDRAQVGPLAKDRPSAPTYLGVPYEPPVPRETTPEEDYWRSRAGMRSSSERNVFGRTGLDEPLRPGLPIEAEHIRLDFPSEPARKPRSDYEGARVLFKNFVGALPVTFPHYYNTMLAGGQDMDQLAGNLAKVFDKHQSVHAYKEGLEARQEQRGGGRFSEWLTEPPEVVERNKAASFLGEMLGVLFPYAILTKPLARAAPSFTRLFSKGGRLTLEAMPTRERAIGEGLYALLEDAPVSLIEGINAGNEAVIRSILEGRTGERGWDEAIQTMLGRGAASFALGTSFGLLGRGEKVEGKKELKTKEELYLDRKLTEEEARAKELEEARYDPEPETTPMEELMPGVDPQVEVSAAAVSAKNIEAELSPEIIKNIQDAAPELFDSSGRLKTDAELDKIDTLNINVDNIVDGGDGWFESAISGVAKIFGEKVKLEETAFTREKIIQKALQILAAPNGISKLVNKNLVGKGSYFPEELSGSAPRFNERKIEWDSPIDKALYIIAPKKDGTRSARYNDFMGIDADGNRTGSGLLGAFPDKTIDEIVGMGRKVKRKVGEMYGAEDFATRTGGERVIAFPETPDSMSLNKTPRTAWLPEEGLALRILEKGTLDRLKKAGTEYQMNKTPETFKAFFAALQNQGFVQHRVHGVAQQAGQSLWMHRINVGGIGSDLALDDLLKRKGLLDPEDQAGLVDEAMKVLNSDSGDFSEWSKFVAENRGKGLIGSLYSYTQAALVSGITTINTAFSSGFARGMLLGPLSSYARFAANIPRRIIRRPLLALLSDPNNYVPPMENKNIPDSLKNIGATLQEANGYVHGLFASAGNAWSLARTALRTGESIGPARVEFGGRAEAPKKNILSRGILALDAAIKHQVFSAEMYRLAIRRARDAGIDKATAGKYVKSRMADARQREFDSLGNLEQTRDISLEDAASLTGMDVDQVRASRDAAFEVLADRGKYSKYKEDIDAAIELANKATYMNDTFLGKLIGKGKTGKPFAFMDRFTGGNLDEIRKNPEMNKQIRIAADQAYIATPGRWLERFPRTTGALQSEKLFAVVSPLILGKRLIGNAGVYARDVSRAFTKKSPEPQSHLMDVGTPMVYTAALLFAWQAIKSGLLVGGSKDPSSVQEWSPREGSPEERMTGIGPEPYVINFDALSEPLKRVTGLSGSVKIDDAFDEVFGDVIKMWLDVFDMVDRMAADGKSEAEIEEAGTEKVGGVMVSLKDHLFSEEWASSVEFFIDLAAELNNTRHRGPTVEEMADPDAISLPRTLTNKLREIGSSVVPNIAKQALRVATDAPLIAEQLPGLDAKERINLELRPGLRGHEIGPLGRTRDEPWWKRGVSRLPVLGAVANIREHTRDPVALFVHDSKADISPIKRALSPGSRQGSLARSISYDHKYRKAQGEMVYLAIEALMGKGPDAGKAGLIRDLEGEPASVRKHAIEKEAQDVRRKFQEYMQDPSSLVSEDAGPLELFYRKAFKSVTGMDSGQVGRAVGQGSIPGFELGADLIEKNTNDTSASPVDIYRTAKKTRRGIKEFVENTLTAPFLERFFSSGQQTSILKQELVKFEKAYPEIYSRTIARKVVSPGLGGGHEKSVAATFLEKNSESTEVEVFKGAYAIALLTGDTGEMEDLNDRWKKREFFDRHDRYERGKEVGRESLEALYGPLEVQAVEFIKESAILFEILRELSRATPQGR